MNTDYDDYNDYSYENYQYYIDSWEESRGE
jgi:hypothetical protein